VNRADLKSLCEVSKCLNAVSIPYLYESITFSTTELSMAGLRYTVDNIPPAHMKYTKDIWIKAPFHRRLENRCLHHDDSRFSDEAVELSLAAEIDDNEEVIIPTAQ